MAGTVEEFHGERIILAEGPQIERVYLVSRGVGTVGLYKGIKLSLRLYASEPGTVRDMHTL